MFWPGTEVPLAGGQPDDWVPYDGAVSNGDRVDRVLEWLARPEDRKPAFTTLYFSAVDTMSHRHAPASPEVLAAVAEIDVQIGRLVDGIARLGLAGRATVIVVSDHGMSATSADRQILIDDYIDLSTIDLVEWGPLGSIAVAPDRVDAVFSALDGRHPAMRVYRKEHLPDRLHYRAHPRIPAIVVLLDDGWVIRPRSRALDPAGGVRGDHGWDPAFRSMHGLFVAAGPGLVPGLVVPPLENVHLYAFMCRILGVTPAPNDGDPAETSGFFRR
jgi:predicted AlkP superfamily pyrophosphatase or phosphodiesterase